MLKGALFFFLALFGLAYLYIVKLQTVDANALREDGSGIRTVAKNTAAPRGIIYDRNGEVLATSVQVFDVIANPLKMTRPRQAAQIIAEALGGDEDEYFQKLKKNGVSQYSKVAVRVDPEKIDILKAAIAELPREQKADRNFSDAMREIAYEMSYKRTYPGGKTAAHVLGFANFENEGIEGIELTYNEILKGTPGVSVYESDHQGNPIPSGVQRVEDPIPGNSIVLTIDKDIQYMAESKLAEAIKRHKAVSGSFVVLNPKTGEIFAAGSAPSFNPNRFNKSKAENRRNRAISDLYEPGSTLKPVTIAGALEAGVVKPRTKFSVPDRLKVGSRTIRDSSPHATATWTTSEILEQSSNVGTTLIAKKMGDDKLYETFNLFQLNQKPEIDFPAAARGMIPETSRWVDVSLSNFSFGQGISMSPLQLASAIGTIANRGVLEQAHFLKDVPSDPSLVPEWESTEVISSKSCEQVNKMMLSTMTDGTGQGTEVKGYNVAGKTGTAQKAVQGQGYIKGKYMGSFIGYLPAEDPELLVYIVLDEPKAGYYGSVVAGRAFSEVATFAAKKLGLSPIEKNASSNTEASVSVAAETNE